MPSAIVPINVVAIYIHVVAMCGSVELYDRRRCGIFLCRGAHCYWLIRAAAWPDEILENTYLRDVEAADEIQMCHRSIVWYHCEVETCNVIVDEVWGYDCSKIEEVGIGLLDFCPDPFDDICFHVLDAEVVMYRQQRHIYMFLLSCFADSYGESLHRLRQGTSHGERRAELNRRIRREGSLYPFTAVLESRINHVRVLLVMIVVGLPRGGSSQPCLE